MESENIRKTSESANERPTDDTVPVVPGYSEHGESLDLDKTLLHLMPPSEFEKSIDADTLQGGGFPGISGEGALLPPASVAGVFSAGIMILGRYQVLSVLGKGGMGIVYECFDLDSGIKVAVKTIAPELSGSLWEMEQVKENFQLVHNLHHPNIASYNALSRDKTTGLYYLIMELVDGEDLRYFLRRKKQSGEFSEDLVVAIIKQIADALDYAHSEKILHRDIKPGNIMIDRKGSIKLLDFGLAAQIHSSLSRVSMQKIDTSGTLPYIAPEQWLGAPPERSSDQYALAATVYEIFSGYPPFDTPDKDIMRDCVLNRVPRPLNGVSSVAADAVARALSKAPEMRFGSCSEFADAMTQKQIEEKSDPAAVKKLSSWAWGWVGAFLLMIVAAIIWLIVANDAVVENSSQIIEQSRQTGAAQVSQQTEWQNEADAERKAAIAEYTAFAEQDIAEKDWLKLKNTGEKLAALGAENAQQYIDRANAELEKEQQAAAERKVEAERLQKKLEEQNKKEDFTAQIVALEDLNSKLRLQRKNADRIRALARQHAVSQYEIDQAEEELRRLEAVSSATLDSLRRNFEELQKRLEYQKKSTARTRKLFEAQATTRSALEDAEEAQRQLEAQCKNAEILFRKAESYFSKKPEEVTQSPVRQSAQVQTVLPSTEHLSASRTIILPGNVKMQLNLVKAGTFTMGSPESEASHSPDEQQHGVNLSADYYMNVSEVTQGQWQALMGENIRDKRDRVNRSWPLRGEGENYPMYYVSWKDANDFCNKLNTEGLAPAGWKFALPTEAQWEFAARGGNNGKNIYYIYSGGNNLGAVGWYKGNSNRTTHPVGKKQANALGLYDMNGNVWEWCSDYYGEYPDDDVTDPTGPQSGRYRVCRGGSWDFDAGNCRTADRLGWEPGGRLSSLGFRVVLVPAE